MKNKHKTIISKQDLVQTCKKWVYCIDCGLLIEPWTVGKKKLTICNICKQVYIQTNHPWLKKMLALHLTNSNDSRFSLKNLFVCKKCGNYFADKQAKKQSLCKWCALLNQNKNITQMCVFCGKKLNNKYKTQKVICSDCIKVLDNVKTALSHIRRFLANKETKIQRQQ
jgi:DNA-directed RNA polymerase subunit RPC12/RpoP